MPVSPEPFFPGPAPKNPLVLTLNIPFCKRRCDFCEAHVLADTTSAFKESYVVALYAEMAALAPDMGDYRVVAIRIAGGSPNLLGGAVLAEMLGNVFASFDVAPDCEVSVAMAPVCVSADALERLKRAVRRHGGAQARPVRIELEMDTSDALEHESLGIAYPLGAYADMAQILAASGGFDLDVSVLYGLRGQSPASVAASVDTAVALGADHVTLRPLRLVPGTRVAEDYVRRAAGTAEKGALVEKPALAEKGTLAEKPAGAPSPSPRYVYPAEERLVQLYQTAVVRLEAHGLRRYTQRHCARPGHECRAVREFCAGCEELALGLDAASCYGGIMCRNTADIDVYLRESSQYEKVMVEGAALSEREAASRRVAAGLLAVEGIAAGEAAADKLAPFEARGWIERADGRACLTARGSVHWDDICRELDLRG